MSVSRTELAEVQRQCAETAGRPLWVLPAAWFEPGVAERMAEWINRSRGEKP